MHTIKYAEAESNRFGKKIYRGSMNELDIPALQDIYSANDPDILIFRIPVAEQHKMYLLHELDKEIINADTLVYYDVDLGKTTYPAKRNESLVIEPVAGERKKEFELLIPEIFKDYTNHYYSNPQLDKDKIAAGYMEWVMNSVGVPGHVQYIAYKDGKAAGFITCSYDDKEAEIILNGVLPQYQKGGIYSDLVRHVKDHFGRLGIKKIKVSTQIQNIAVQRVWNKEGFILSSAYVTLHLNRKAVK